MSKIKTFVNNQVEQINGHIGLFLIAVISFACEHNIIRQHNTVSETS